MKTELAKREEESHKQENRKVKSRNERADSEGHSLVFVVSYDKANQ